MGGVAMVGRRGALALGAATVLAACTASGESPDGDRIRTDSEPLERRFAALGPLSRARWLGLVLGTDSRVSVPGPTDVRVVGFARLRAGRVAALVEASRWDFQPETPSGLPETLAEFMPEGARWVRSESFDHRMTGGTYPGEFYFDPVADRVCFDTTNPSPAAGSGTVTG